MASFPAQTRPWRSDADGLWLLVRATPGARRAGVGGVMATAEGVALRVMVTEAPDKGRANKAIITLLAKTLGLPKSAISIRRGESARLKQLHIAADESKRRQLADMLARLAQA